jgi:hypothetical protein
MLNNTRERHAAGHLVLVDGGAAGDGVVHAQKVSRGIHEPSANG